MLYLITPLKDELNNIPRLIESIENQTVGIDWWIIVENDSSDGSKEYLRELNTIANVKNLKIINLQFEDKSYSIGEKYSTVVNQGGLA